LVGVSEEIRKYYEKWYSSSILEVIYNGVTEPDRLTKPDSDVIQVIESLRSRGLKVMGSAAILTKRKGFDQVLFLLEKVNDLAFIIIGNGKEHKKLQRLARKLKVSDRCHFCGMRSGAVNYFKNFDFLVMPSRSEGFGLTLMEAVQQKVPVICSDIPVFKELFNEEEVSFFKLEDLDSLASALRKTSESGSKKASLAYIKYQNNYTALHMAKRYFELYQSAS
jgi:L-malate glycosyltransferase